MIKKSVTLVLALIAILIVAVAIAIMTFDINKYRGQIEAELGKVTGRTVKLNGEIHVGLGLKGMSLSIKDVALGNPEWASRPNLASLKKFDLKVGLLPLLEHKVDIQGIDIEEADILLESTGGNKHNWDIVVSKAKEETAPEKEAKKPTSSEPVAINITSLTIKNSRIAIKDEAGKLTTFMADALSLGAKGIGMGLDFKGSLNAMPITLAVLTDSSSLMSQKPRPLDVKLDFANFTIAAKGKIDVEGKKTDFDTYEIVSGATKLNGKMSASWGGARPAIKGSIASDKIDPSDLALKGGAETPQGGKDDSNTAVPAPNERMFSDAPLPLDGLKAADVDMDFAIGAFPAGSVELQNLKGKLVLQNGHLVISPLNMALGSGTIDGLVNLDASVAPAKFGTKLTIDNVDLSDLIKASGASAFLTGKVKADINLASNGNSMHELASNVNGVINVLGAGGDVITSTSDRMASALATLLSPGGGTQHAGMNCVVARMIGQNGIIKSNGILIDTMAATAAGYGGIDLRNETIDMDFRARSKLLNVGGLVPPVTIKGSLKKPEIGADAQSIVQNVGRMLLSGGGLTGGDSGVPTVSTTTNGQNACASALDNPSNASNATPDKGGLVQDLIGKASGSLKGGDANDLAGKAGQALKGLFGQ